MPYSSYEHFDFKVPVGTVGDNYDRYRVRLAEMRESLKIVEQALDGLPEGPWITTNRKVALPPRHELATSMEALIHHFKLVTEGFRVPPGEAYSAIESPRGELGCFVVADGSAKPARVHMRDPSFVNLQALPDMVEGRADRRLHRLRGDARPDPGRRGPVSDPAAIRAAPLPPGWDEAVRLGEPPPTVPDPADVEVPAELRAEIEGYMARYPDRHSAALPALGAAQRVHGWCSPEAIHQVAAVMQVTPAYLSSVATFYDMLRTRPTGSRYVYVCTSVACHLRTPRRSTTRSPPRRASRASRTWRCASSSASAPATWRRWPRSTAATSGRSRQRRRRARARRDGGPRAVPRPRAGGRLMPETRVLLEHIDEPGLTRSTSTSASAATRRCARRCSR